jgi:hypothetical protein
VLWAPFWTRLHGLLDPFSFNGDALQHIAPMWFVHLAPNSVSDYTLRYYLEAILPPLFKAIYALLTYWMTPIAASKLLTALLSLAFISISTLTTIKLAGRVAGSFSFFLATAGVLKNMYFMGGIQRGFGFWLASLALYLVCSGHLVALGAVGIVAAMLYPAASVCIITTLSLLTLLPAEHRGALAEWSLKKRLSLLGVTAALIGLAVMPQLAGGHRYGDRLSIDAAGEFAEWGPHGRYTPGDRGVPISLGSKSLAAVVSVLAAESTPRAAHTDITKIKLNEDESAARHSDWPIYIVVASALAGTGLTLSRRFSVSSQTLRCCVFGLGILIAFLAARAVFPLLYIPSRYMALGVTALTPVIFPAIWCCTIEALTLKAPRSIALVTKIILVSSILAALGWGSLSPKRLPTTVGNRALFAAIKALPQDAIIAAWPRGVANMIPLFTAHSVLVFEEGHQIFHRDFLEEMRRRIRGIIAVFASTEIEPVNQLIKDFNVSHLLINKRHLTRIPDYFAPFGVEMRQARQNAGKAPLILEQLIKTNAIFSDRDYVLVRLRPSAERAGSKVDPTMFRD